MAQSDLTDSFAGLPVTALPPAGQGAPGTGPGSGTDPGSVAWRLAVGTGDTESFAARFARFLTEVDVTRVRALVIGAWGSPWQSSSAEAVALLARSATRFTALEHVFLGDIGPEEAEISWIMQSDVTPLLEAFPALRTLVVRGGSGLVLRPSRHEGLRHLEVRSGGLPPEVVRAVGASTLPALTELVLWLGVFDYGGATTVSDTSDLMAGVGVPALTHLGLLNSEITDELAGALAHAPLTGRLRELDLSMGTLGDAGAQTLLTARSFTHLRSLTVRHHFVSEPLCRRLTETLGAAGVEVRLSEPQKADSAEERYTEVAE